MAEDLKDDDLFADPDDGDPGEGSGDGDNSSGSPDPDPTDGSPDPKDERIKALMSRAQKAEAALAKAQKTPTDGKPNDASPGDKGEKNTDTDEMKAYFADQVRGDLFKRLELDQYFGDDPAVIEGSSLAEIKASADRLRKLADRAQSAATQAAFQEAGISPGIGGGGPQKPVDYGAMSREDFLKLVDENRM